MRISTGASLEYQRGRAWTTFALYAALIVYLSHQPGDPNAVLPFPHFDKLVHFCEYGVFAFFLMRALRFSNVARAPIFAWGGALLFGVTDEFHQYFVPLRSCDWRDLLADALGAAIVVFVYHKIARPSGLTAGESLE